MAGSAYLLPGDYAPFGVPNATLSQVQQASDLIDSYLLRPDGCVWAPDAAGNPCYMAAKLPSFTYMIETPIAPGTAVTVPIPGLVGNDTMIGEVVILDASNAAIVEACVIQSFAAGQVVLQSVQYDHPGTSSAPVRMDLGLAINEELDMPNQRSLVILAAWPIMRIISGVGRYGYGRRSDQMLGYFDDVNLLSMFSSFGGPPAWESFEIAASSYNPRTGEVWVPAGILLAYFTEVKMRYVGGWQASALPRPIKRACARLIGGLTAAPMGPNIRRFTAGKITVERFGESVLDDDTKSLLRPYRATVLG